MIRFLACKNGGRKPYIRPVFKEVFPALLLTSLSITFVSTAYLHARNQDEGLKVLSIKKLESCETTYTITRLDSNKLFFANGACVATKSAGTDSRRTARSNSSGTYGCRDVSSRQRFGYEMSGTKKEWLYTYLMNKDGYDITFETHIQFILDADDCIITPDTDSDMTILKRSDFEKDAKIKKIRVY